jgi:hypothetical protein
VGGSGAAGGKSAAAAMPGAPARTIKIAKRMMSNEIHTTYGTQQTEHGYLRRIPIQQEFPE